MVLRAIDDGPSERGSCLRILSLLAREDWLSGGGTELVWGIMSRLCARPAITESVLGGRAGGRARARSCARSRRGAGPARVAGHVLIGSPGIAAGRSSRAAGKRGRAGAIITTPTLPSPHCGRHAGHFGVPSPSGGPQETYPAWCAARHCKRHMKRGRRVWLLPCASLSEPAEKASECSVPAARRSARARAAPAEGVSRGQGGARPAGAAPGPPHGGRFC